MADAPPATLAGELRRLRSFLDEWAEPWALVGGGAIVLRVEPRFTSDLDVLVSVPPRRGADLLALAARHGYGWDAGEVAVLAEGGLVRLWGPPDRARGIGVDLLFAEDEFSQRVLARATPVDVAGHAISVASVEDLLLMKLEANRPQDLDDAIAIKDAFGHLLDRAQLREEAARLDLAGRLAALLGSD